MDSEVAIFLVVFLIASSVATVFICCMELRAVWNSYRTLSKESKAELLSNEEMECTCNKKQGGQGASCENNGGINITYQDRKPASMPPLRKNYNNHGPTHNLVKECRGGVQAFEGIHHNIYHRNMLYSKGSILKNNKKYNYVK